MADIKTVSVVSKDPSYHGGDPFTINEEDFDPENHQLFGVETTETGDEPGLDKMTVAELRAIAADRGIELKGNTTKAAILEALEAQ